MDEQDPRPEATPAESETAYRDPDMRRLDDYVDQFEEIFGNIQGMLACKDLDSLERQTAQVMAFLLEMAVDSLGAVAGEIRERRAVDEALPKRAIFLDRRGRSDEIIQVATDTLKNHDPLGEEVKEPWAGVLEKMDTAGFLPVRTAARPWMPRPVNEGDLEPEVEEVFQEIGSVAVLPYLLRDHRPHVTDRERLAGLQVLYLREKQGEAKEKIERTLKRLKTVGEVALTNRVTMEGLLKRVATFRHQTKGKSLEIEGTSPTVRALRAQIEEVAPQGVERVRIEGPRGAGKKHVAELFHRLSPGASNPFVAVDCARVAAGGEGANPSDYVFRKKLFGDVHAPDLEDAMGAIEQARGGTLFLDGAEHLPLSFQYKFAQVLQEGRFSRLGEEGHVKLDCQLILASESDLTGRVESRRFSSKLLRPFRDAPRLIVPGLNDRREDIPALAETIFHKQVRSQKKHRLRRLAPDTLKHLVERDWSEGNVKALMNWIGWGVARAGLEDGELLPDHLPASLQVKDPQWSVEVFCEDGRPRTFKEYLGEGFRLLETSLGDRGRALTAWDVNADEVSPWLE